jgi:hypothetical protein
LIFGILFVIIIKLDSMRITQMAEQVQMWKSKNGVCYLTEEKAEAADLMHDVLIVLKSTTEGYDYPFDEVTLRQVADMLVDTDLFAQLQTILAGKL